MTGHAEQLATESSSATDKSDPDDIAPATIADESAPGNPAEATTTHKPAPDRPAQATAAKESVPDEPVHTAAARSRHRTLVRRCLVAVVVVITAALVVTTAWSVVRHRDDAAVTSADREAGPAAADAAAAILTYKPATVTADLARARSHLSGDFATYFDKLGTEVVLPAATTRHMSSTATVTATSVVSASSDHAVALVFVNQMTTADDLKQPTTMSSSLRLELHKIGGHWLVTKLDTV